MDKWEYKEHRIFLEIRTSGQRSKRDQDYKKLQDLGSSGWECCGVTHYGNYMICLLKRSYITIKDVELLGLGVKEENNE